jgi:hypothetical protein
LAAAYLHVVVNDKYRVEGLDICPYEWEIFLSLERQLSTNLWKRNIFVLDAAFVLNAFMTFFAASLFYISVRQPDFVLSRLAGAAFAAGIVGVIFAYHGHFTAHKPWKALVSRPQASRFKERFPRAAKSDPDKRDRRRTSGQ